MERREQSEEIPSWRQTLDAYTSAKFIAETFHTDKHVQEWLKHHARVVDELEKPGLFELGQIMATPTALGYLTQNGRVAEEFLLRHKNGDFGALDESDIQENLRSIEEDQRILSRYQVMEDESIYVITEWDRSFTTVLLPEEY